MNMATHVHVSTARVTGFSLCPGWARQISKHNFGTLPRRFEVWLAGLARITVIQAISGKTLFPEQKTVLGTPIILTERYDVFTTRNASLNQTSLVKRGSPRRATQMVL